MRPSVAATPIASFPLCSLKRLLFSAATSLAGSAETSVGEVGVVVCFTVIQAPKKSRRGILISDQTNNRVFLLHLSIGPQRDGFRYLLTFITLFSLCLSTCVTQRYHRVRPCWRLAIHCPITQEHYAVQLNAKTTNYSFIDVQEAVGGNRRRERKSVDKTTRPRITRAPRHLASGAHAPNARSAASSDRRQYAR